MLKYSIEQKKQFYWMKRLDANMRWTNDKNFPFIMPILKSFDMDWDKTWAAVDVQFMFMTEHFWKRDELDQRWPTIDKFRSDFKEMTQYMFTLGEYRERLAQEEWERQGWTVNGDLTPTLERAKIDQILTKGNNQVYVSVKGPSVLKGHRLKQLKGEMIARNPGVDYMMVAIVDEKTEVIRLRRV